MAVVDGRQQAGAAMADTGSENGGVILRAFIANLGIAVAKFVASFLTGSAAMFTEGVHSLVDTTNELLLFHGERQTRRDADDIHPLGYGREQYFWSFVVAELVFTMGAGVAVYQGLSHWDNPQQTESPAIALLVLVVALLLEGWSLRAAVRNFNRQRGGKSFIQGVRDSADTTTLAVLFEDSAAVIGLLVAAAGISLEIYTGDARWDAVASLAIGAVLGIVALALLVKTKSLLIGKVADPAIDARIREIAVQYPCVARVMDVITIQAAAENVTCIVTIDFDDTILARDVEGLSVLITRQVVVDLPIVRRLYICPRNELMGNGVIAGG